MNGKLIGAYIGAVFSGLVILVAVLLGFLQWGVSSEFSLFGKPVAVNTALLILACVVFGALLPWLLKMLVHCITTIGQCRRESAKLNKAAAKAVVQQSTPTDQS